MSDVFRLRVREDLTRLLAHWKQVEFWIKRAEQVSGEAVIPAINELRYASRQIFQVVRLIEKAELNAGERHTIDKRLAIGEQYLLNADHDVCDAIISFFAENIKHLDDTYGMSEIAMYFPEYPLLRKRIKECYALVADSRGEYNNRKNNYEDIRENSLRHIIESYHALVDAEVSARVAKNRLKTELAIALGTKNIFYWFSVIAGTCSIVAVPLSIYLWFKGPQAFCKRNSSRPILSYFCSFASTDDGLSAIIPPSGEIKDASTHR